MRKPPKQRRAVIIITCLAALILSVGLFNFTHGKNKLYRKSQVLMGTFVEVFSPDRAAPAIVFAEIKRVENQLSKYIADSDVSQLNRLGRLNVSLETMYVLRKAKEFWLASDGAFDITVGPLVDLWGFSQKKYTVVTPAQIKAVLPLIGMDKIIFHEENNLVKFMVPGMKIDLGGIAKGFAVDCAVRKLREKGIDSCLINAGGQIYCLGDKFGKPWIIAIQHPRDPSILEPQALKNQAAATSGDYQQYFMKDGRRYFHIFNPKTGFPADSGVISATVIARDSMTADALSTAIVVMGKEKWQELANSFPDVKARIIEAKDIQDEE